MEISYNKNKDIILRRLDSMGNKELAKNLIDQIPEGKLLYIIPYLQGAAIPDNLPNSDTIEAIEEIENGRGHAFKGSTEDLFKKLMED